MSLESLESTQKEIEEYKQLDKELSEKLATAERVKTKELASQHLLNFELSRLNAEVLVHREEVSRLEKEHVQLEKSANELMFFLKRIRNSTILNNIRFDRKDAWVTKLRQGLETMDFTVETYEDNPHLSINAATQFPADRRRMIP